MTLPDTKHLCKILGVLLAFLVCLSVTLYLLTWGILKLLDSVEDDLSKAIIAGSVAVLGSAFTLVFGKLWEQRIKIQDEIRAKKVPIYEAHVSTFFKIFFGHRDSTKPPTEVELKKIERENVKAFEAFAEQMVTWGSSDVIKAWVDFKKLDSMQEAKPDEKLEILENLFRSIRKDLGNDVRSLKRLDLLRMFVNGLPDD